MSRVLTCLLFMMLFISLHSIGFTQTDKGSTTTTMKPQIDTEKGPETFRITTIDSDTGPINVEIQGVRIRTSFSDGRSGVDLLLVMREPRSGLFWWTNQHLDPSTADYANDQLPALLKRYKIVLSENKLVGFQLAWTRLMIRECHDQQPSMEKTIHAIVDIVRDNLNDPNGDPTRGGWRAIELTKKMGRGFFYGSVMTAQMRSSELANIVRSNSTWTATLIGPDGEHGEILLDDNFVVQKATNEGKHYWKE